MSVQELTQRWTGIQDRLRPLRFGKWFCTSADREAACEVAYLVEDLFEYLASQQNGIDALLKENTWLEVQLSEAKKEVKAKESSIGYLSDALTNVQKHSDELSRELRRQEELTVRLPELTSRLTELEDALEDTRDRLSSAGEVVDNLQQKLSAINGIIHAKDGNWRLLSTEDDGGVY